MPNKYDTGICTKCKEHTPLGEPCCNAPVFFEGSYYDETSFDNEDIDYAENAAELRRECEKDG
jgi:hypothetical protein